MQVEYPHALAARRREQRLSFRGAVVTGMLLAALSMTCGCARQMDARKASVDQVAKQLDASTVSNLIREASLWIEEAQAVGEKGISYRSKRIPLPVAQGLGSDVWVDIDSPDGPCMVIQVPVVLDHLRACQVYLTVKPTGGITSDAESVRFSDQIRLKALQR